MEPKTLQEIENLAERDGRYKSDAYLFLYDALGYTAQKLGKNNDTLSEEKRHISGRDLLFGISEYSADQFGPLTRSVFTHWGIEQRAILARLSSTWSMRICCARQMRIGLKTSLMCTILPRSLIGRSARLTSSACPERGGRR